MSTRIKVVLIVSILIACSSAIRAQDDVSALLLRFQAASDRGLKESVLGTITTGHRDAGPALLKIARESNDDDTKWLAIRGIGYLKFAAAAPFLKQSLTSNSHYVRANAARALGEIHDSSAASDLMRALQTEQDSGVIEQGALALEMLGAKEALPVLESKAGNPSPQTRLWILGAVDILGSKAEVPFLAGFLSDQDLLVALHAAHAIERLTGEDFGLPKCGKGPCGLDETGIQNAQHWWNEHKEGWKQ